MKNKAKLFGIYLPAFILFLLASVALRTVALFLHFDTETFYFGEKAVITAADIIITVGAVFFLTYIFSARKNMKLIPSFTTPATYVPTGIVSISIVFVIIFTLVKASGIKENMDYLSMIGTPQALSLIRSERIVFILLIATALFAALSLVHFVLTALDERHSSTKRASFGICTVIFLSLYVVYLYFNTELPLNAPNKIVDQMAYLAASLFFLYETRLSLGRERWRAYISFGFIASLLSAYASIPSAIYYFATKNVTTNNVYEIALTFALFIFITARILLTGELIEDKPSATVESLIKYANMRDATLNPPVPEVVDITGEAIDETGDEVEDDGNQIKIEYFGDENGEITPIIDSDEPEDDNSSESQNDNEVSEAE